MRLRSDISLTSACSLLIMLASASIHAGDYFSTLEKKKKPHIRMGISVRSIGVDFTASPGALNLPTSLRGSTFGAGDVGLFTGGTGSITYDNGTVGGDRGVIFLGGIPTGDALTTIAAGSQLAPTGRSFLDPGSNRVDIQRLTFESSTRTIQETTNASTLPDVGISDDQISVAPYLQFVFPIKEETVVSHDDPKNPIEEPGRFVNAVVGYAFHQTSHGSGPLFAGNRETLERQSRFLYSYDYIGSATPTAPVFPFDGTGVNEGRVIYDAATARFAFPVATDTPEPPFIDPTTSNSVIQTLDSLPVFLTTTLDVDLHEIPFGLEIGDHFGKNKIALNFGGTLNFVNLDLTTRADWFIPGVANPVATQVSNSSKQPVTLGAYLGANLTRPLNEDGSLYLEAHVSYRWVDDLEATVGNTRVDIDLSSLEGGLMIGYHFD